MTRTSVPCFFYNQWKLATPNTFCPIVLIALACTVLPIPNEAIAVNKAKSELACRCCAG